MSIKQGRIDVHHHILPPVFTQALQRQGLQLYSGGQLEQLGQWSVDQSLEVMDVLGIDHAITSVPTAGTRPGGKVAEAFKLARACNEFAADLCSRHPKHFGSFALLPLPFVEASCAEAVHALDVLQADGVVVHVSNEGVFLGDPRLDELMVELDRRAAVVFVHPNLQRSSNQPGKQAPGFLIELLCDTARAAINLILEGILERYPRIRWILSHSGGFLPYIVRQLTLANATPHAHLSPPKGVLTNLQRFYFDTSALSSCSSMSAHKELIDPSHTLYGSDFPFALPPPSLGCPTSKEDSLWLPKQQIAPQQDHALHLFPRFNKAYGSNAGGIKNSSESIQL